MGTPDLGLIMSTKIDVEPFEKTTAREAEPLTIIGKPNMKVDAMAKVSGETLFADDLALPRMLFCKLLRSPHPHARIVKVDVRKAQAMPGVAATLVGSELPIPFGILPVSQDEHALCFDKVRFVGDPVAAVAALDEETAERALRLIDVEYEVLPPVMSIEEALAPGRARDSRGRALSRERPEGGVSPVRKRRRGFRRGGPRARGHVLLRGQHASAPRAALRSRELRRRRKAHPLVFHADAALRAPGDGEGPRDAALPDPESSPARTAAASEGRAIPFNHEIVVAKLSMKTRRPVKVTLNREEVFYCHRGRHPVAMWVKTGVKKNGAITAMHFRSFLDGGAYGSYGVASLYYTGALQTVTYKVPRYKFEGLRVFTNKPPCGPKRGHGTVQPRYAIECHLDKIAEAIGKNPLDLRLERVVEPFSTTANHLQAPHRRLEGMPRARRRAIGVPEEARKASARTRHRPRGLELHHGRGPSHLLEPASP